MYTLTSYWKYITYCTHVYVHDMYMIAYCIAGNLGGGTIFVGEPGDTIFLRTKRLYLMLRPSMLPVWYEDFTQIVEKHENIAPPPPPTTITYLTKYTNFQAPTHINFRCPNIQSCILYLTYLHVQPDNNTAQYVLKMMISQHKFYRAELEDTPGLSWLASGVEG